MDSKIHIPYNMSERISPSSKAKMKKPGGLICEKEEFISKIKIH